MNHPLRLIFLGPPGAGKGTQSVIISNKLSIPHISTGDMLRSEVASQSPLGKQVKGLLDAGTLVPDEIVLELIQKRLSAPDCANGFMLDGYPRNVSQGKTLAELLQKISKPITHVVDLRVAEEVLLERIRSRGQASGRSDDTVEVASKRLKVYWEQTAPLSAFYQAEKQIKYVAVDGLGSVEEVQNRILASLV